MCARSRESANTPECVCVYMYCTYVFQAPALSKQLKSRLKILHVKVPRGTCTSLLSVKEPAIIFTQEASLMTGLKLPHSP